MLFPPPAAGDGRASTAPRAGPARNFLPSKPPQPLRRPSPGPACISARFRLHMVSISADHRRLREYLRSHRVQLGSGFGAERLRRRRLKTRRLFRRRGSRIRLAVHGPLSRRTRSGSSRRGRARRRELAQYRSQPQRPRARRLRRHGREAQSQSRISGNHPGAIGLCRHAKSPRLRHRRPRLRRRERDRVL